MTVLGALAPETAELPAPEGLGRDVLVVGGSAGGVTALRTLVAALPADLPACVLVVLHLPRSGGTSVLPQVLARGSALPVRSAQDGDALVPGQVLVAPAERHLVVVDGRVALSSGPVENGQRPSVDVLFRSAAHELGPRVVGLVLTGNLDDGSAGLRAVRRHGGAALVQDPSDALFPGMPRNALTAVPEAESAPLAALPAIVTALVRAPRGPAVERPVDADRDRSEVLSALGHDLGTAAPSHPGRPSAYSCPDCSGVLFALDDGPLLRYRCRVGHAWSVESLSERQEDTVETALWVALRALEERSAMARDAASAAERSGRAWSQRHFSDRADEASRHAGVLRSLLVDDPGRPAPAPADVPSAG